MTNPLDQDRPPEPERPRGGRRKDGRRGDPNATVPDAEFVSYYGRNIVKPAPWGNEIAEYLFLGGMAAGSGLVATGAHLTNRPTLRRNARFGALAALALGGTALVVDLGRPERFFNMMRVAKLTSPMSVGTWILSGFGAFTGLATGLEVVVPLFKPGTLLRAILDVTDSVASAGAAFFAPPLAAYTAVLLADTATPLWHQAYRELPFIFVSSGMAAGCGLNLVITPTSETRPVRHLAAIGAACDLAADAVLERRLGEEGEPLRQGVAHRLHTAAKVLTAAGAVGALLGGKNRVVAAASGLALMAGSACTRFAVYKAGLTSAEDPIYTIRPQRKRAEESRLKGNSISQPGGDWPAG